MFADNELWKSVPDRDRRDLYDDILHQLEKKEKVRVIHVEGVFCANFYSQNTCIKQSTCTLLILESPLSQASFSLLCVLTRWEWFKKAAQLLLIRAQEIDFWSLIVCWLM